MAKVTRKQIVLRVPSEIKRSVVAAARKAGLSLNGYAEKVLGRAAARA